MKITGVRQLAKSLGTNYQKLYYLKSRNLIKLPKKKDGVYIITDEFKKELSDSLKIDKLIKQNNTCTDQEKSNINGINFIKSMEKRMKDNS